MKKICWFDIECYLNQELLQLMKDNNIIPMVDDALTFNIWNEFKQPQTLRYYTFYVDNITPYFDEPFSIKKPLTEFEVKQMVRNFPDIVLGDTNPDKIKTLVNCGCNNVLYTAYGQYWPCASKIVGCNIHIPFTNQLVTVQLLRKEFSNKVNAVWVFVDQNIKTLEEIFTFAKLRNMDVYMTHGDSLKNPAPFVLEKMKVLCALLNKLGLNKN